MQNPPLPPCYTAQLFRPLLDELLKTLRSLDGDDWQRPTLAPVRALPHAFRGVVAPSGTAVTLRVTGRASGGWTLVRGGDNWQLSAGERDQTHAAVEMPADVAWRVLYNAPYDRSRVTISGDAALAAPLLGARSVIV